MVVSVIPGGNSKGIRIPQNILAELNIENEAEMNISNDEIIIRRIEKNPGEGWEESFKKMRQAAMRPVAGSSGPEVRSQEQGCPPRGGI